MSLSETALLTAGGDRVYGRGEDYVRYVRGLCITADQAKQVYSVELDWSGGMESSAVPVCGWSYAG